MENVLVWLIVGLAGGFVLRSFFGKMSSSGKSCCEGGCRGCGAHESSAPQPKKTSVPQ